MIHTYYGSFTNSNEQISEDLTSRPTSSRSTMSAASTTQSPTEKKADPESAIPNGEVGGSTICATNDIAPIVGDDEQAPDDKYSVVYFIFLLHGVGVLLPWNTFLTIAQDYFINFKLSEANGTHYQTNFFSYLGACSQIPNLLCNLINLFIIVHGAGLVRRIFGALFIITAICFFTIIMIPVDSESWPFSFFLITMVSVVLLNSANGIYQNSIFGLASDFPWRFINAVILGSNTCGTFISILAIFTMLFSSNIQWAAVLYFSIALFTIIACIVSFASLRNFSFYRYYVQKAEKTRNAKYKPENMLLNKADDSQTDIEPEVSLQAYIAVFKESWRHMLDVFLVFFVTLTLFPTVLVRVKHYDLFMDEKYFTAVFVFLNFNAFALLGNFIANYIQWPSPKYLSLIVVPRLLFIPLFWLCNYIPGAERKLLPVLLPNVWVFIILIALMAVSHGYCSSLAMMYAPKVVHDSKSQLAGMMSAFILVLGITVGVLFTFAEAAIFS